MIHVATVHWRDDRWVDVQLRHLERFLPEHRVYAFLNGLDRDHSDRFFYSSDEKVREHSTKLNLLADIIGFAAASDADPLLFIDGDAFPIADLRPLIEEDLPRKRLIAVRRDEASDVQPHPCFCLTTVGTWRELGGDWRKGGHSWVNDAGREVSDVGARVLRAVEEHGLEWRALTRSNRRNPHPLFFGVYDDLVYHHGAGFRKARGGRLLIADRGVHEARASLRARALDALPKNRFGKRMRRRFHPARRINKQLQDEATALSDEWFERLQHDPEFFRELIRDDAAA